MLWHNHIQRKVIFFLFFWKRENCCDVGLNAQWSFYKTRTCRKDADQRRFPASSDTIDSLVPSAAFYLVVDKPTLLQSRLHSFFVWKHPVETARQRDQAQKAHWAADAYLQKNKIKTSPMSLLTSSRWSCLPGSPAALTWCTWQKSDNTNRAR